jgi:hypothetical protein
MPTQLFSPYEMRLAAMPAHEPTDVPGLVEPGNINYAERPVVHNADGSISSVASSSFTQEDPNKPYYGKEILIPTVIHDKNGKWYVDPDEKNFPAAKAYYYKTGQHMGIFTNGDAADDYAERVHLDYMNGLYGPQYVPKWYAPTYTPAPVHPPQPSQVPWPKEWR